MMTEGSNNIVKFAIPLPCPKCDGKMYVTRYVIEIQILEQSSLQICKVCGFRQKALDFKDQLCTV
jgi:C4-type Zn-finger protein